MPTRCNVFILIILAVSSTDMRHAHADYVPDTCVFHFPGDAPTDRHVVDLLKQVEKHIGSGGAVRSCPATHRETGFHILEPISKENRVSYYYEKQVFLKENKNEIEWTFWPPKHLHATLGSMQITTAYMCGEEFSCDRHDANGFVHTKGLSPYLFRKLQDAWSGMSGSEAAFDGVFEKSSQDKSIISNLSSFRTYVFKYKEIYHKISSANFSGRSLMVGAGPPRFMFEIGTNGGVIFLMEYEYSEDGIRLLSLLEGHP